MEAGRIDIESNFAETAALRGVADRALLYLRAGYAVNLQGPSGVGKTCLALYIARLLGRPAELIFGNEDSVAVDLIGGSSGMDRKVVYDNYVHSVIKLKECYTPHQIEGRLIDACRSGKTLIYDEFTRTRPEINNILLPVLEERVLNLPLTGKVAHVHKDFRLIFTSNPQEYTGVYNTQDALASRMVTLEIDYPDSETEIAVVARHSGLAEGVCEAIVAVTQRLRSNPSCRVTSSLRSAIMIGKTLQVNAIPLSDPERVLAVFKDILMGGTSAKLGVNERRTIEGHIGKLVKEFCKDYTGE